jgi:hypothetical protein
MNNRERTRIGLDIDLEDSKVKRIPADELAPRKLTLQLDLEKPSLGDEKSPSEHQQPQPPPLQHQQKSSKSEIKHEKSGTYFEVLFAFGPWFWIGVPCFLSGFLVLQLCLLLHHLCHYLLVAGWGVSHRLGEFRYMLDVYRIFRMQMVSYAFLCLGSYLGPVPALSAAGLHPMDVKPGSSSGLPVCILTLFESSYLHLFFFSFFTLGLMVFIITAASFIDSSTAHSLEALCYTLFCCTTDPIPRANCKDELFLATTQ